MEFLPSIIGSWECGFQGIMRGEESSFIIYQALVISLTEPHPT
jgi:hypothetical protein